jgi:hypothetical protein
VKELAAELRISPKSIQRAYRKEEIPVQWLGRMARFNRPHGNRAVPVLGVCATTVLYSDPRRGMGGSET